MALTGYLCPTRRFGVVLPAQEVVRVAVDELGREGFSLERWDVDSFLRDYGGGRPWTGAAVRRGHEGKMIVLAPFVYLLCPWALLVPWVRRSLVVVRTAVVARDAGQGRSELLVCVYSSDSEWLDTGTWTAARALNRVRARLADLGVLAAEPETVDVFRDLPEEHPCSRYSGGVSEGLQNGLLAPDTEVMAVLPAVVQGGCV